jgi:hypothetical protein
MPGAALSAKGPSVREARAVREPRPALPVAANSKEHGAADAGAVTLPPLGDVGVWSRWECGPEKGECKIAEGPGGDRSFWRQSELRVLFLVRGRPSRGVSEISH